MTENEPAPPPVPEAAGTTGDPQVDEALRKLAGLAERPLNEHPVVFEQIHGALTSALGTLDPASRRPRPRADPAPATQARAADRAGSFLMSTRRRLDAELVRRGLARSREQAAELISAGRVAVAGQAAGKAATQVGRDDADHGAGRPATTRSTSSRGGAQAGRRAGRVRRRCRWPGGAAWTRARPPAASPTCCCGAGAAARGRGGRGLRPARLGAAQRRPGHRAGPGQRPRSLRPEQVAPPPGLVVADLSFISLSLVLPALVACAAPDADFAAAGQAAVRGGQGPGRRGRRGPGPGAAGRSGGRASRRPRRLASAWPG